MIARIRGLVVYVGTEYSVVETGGVGYKLWVTGIGLTHLRIGEEVSLEVSMQWNRGEPTLYGFFQREELELFERMIRVSGVGAKGALKIVAGGVGRIANAINRGAAEELAAASGTSRKLAGKIILDLRGKVVETATEGNPGVDPIEAAVQTIIGYGFSEEAVRSAVAEVRSNEPDLGLTETVNRVFQQLGKESH